MDSKMESFKEFVKSNPFLIGYIRRGEKSWQDFYEMYDLYGEDEDAWAKLLEHDEGEEKANSSERSSKGSGYFDEIVNAVRKVDVDKIQEGITSLQKTLGLFGDLFAGKGSQTKEYTPRPLYRRFED